MISHLWNFSSKGGLYVSKVVSYGHVKVQKFVVGKFAGDISWTWRKVFFFILNISDR